MDSAVFAGLAVISYPAGMVFTPLRHTAFVRLYRYRNWPFILYSLLFLLPVILPIKQSYWLVVKCNANHLCLRPFDICFEKKCTSMLIISDA